MSDFETHPIGTTKEILLSRALARAIEQELEQWGQVVPNSVYVSYQRLLEHYRWQLESGNDQ